MLLKTPNVQWAERELWKYFTAQMPVLFQTVFTLIVFPTNLVIILYFNIIEWNIFW